MTGERWGRPAVSGRRQRSGEVNAEQVAIIERALSTVEGRGFDPADLDQGEQLLTGFAASFGPKELRMLAEQVVDHIDPDGTLPDDRLNSDRRHLQLRRTRDGAWTGQFWLTGALGSSLSAVLGPLARPRPDTAVTGSEVDGVDPRTTGQRWHDALEDVCDRVVRSDPSLADAGGTPTTLIVTLDLEDLRAKTGYAVASDGTLIPTDKAVRLADQADISYAAVNAKGVPLQLGRSRRIATLGQTAALIARDKGCSFPGCDVAPEYCERHHITAWIDGGSTDLDKVTSGSRHRKLVAVSIVAYCRISADKTGAGLGVERQAADCRDLAATLGLPDPEVLTDNDLSAYSDKRRPGYEQLLEGLREGQWTTLLVWHVDRLCRSVRDLEDIVDLVNGRVAVHTVKGGEINLETPEGRLQARMLGTLARYESEHRSDRVRRALDQNAERGIAHGGPRPYGWTRAGDGRAGRGRDCRRADPPRHRRRVHSGAGRRSAYP